MGGLAVFLVLLATQGAALAGGDFGCAAPTLPAIPAPGQAHPDVRGVREAIAAWERCHARFMRNLRATPADGRFPATTRAALVAAAEAHAQALMVRHATWLGAGVEVVQPPAAPRRSRGARAAVAKADMVR